MNLSFSSVTGRSGALILGVAVALAAACSAGGDPPATGVSSGSGSGATGSGATGGTIVTGSGASSSGGTGIIVQDAGDPEGGTPTRCDDAGVCSCINIAVIGRPPTYGANGMDNTMAFTNWLNSKSSAAADLVTTKPTLTADYLAKYDVIILQALEDKEGGPYWNFSADEIAAFEAWVRAGGGVITLTGYGGQSAEINPTNALLAFTGMSYNTDDILSACPDSCCYCTFSSVPMTGWNTAHPISANITAVGAFHGRSVNAGGGDLVASSGTTVYGATKQMDSGRVFMFNDEWVMYTSQWDGTIAADQSCSVDPNNTCYNRIATVAYQVPQFWYNSVVWASGDRQCFDIMDPAIVK